MGEPLLRSERLSCNSRVGHVFGGADLDVGASLSTSVRRFHLERIVQSLDATATCEHAVFVHQVHGATAVRLHAPGGLSPVGHADALVTDVPGVVLVIQTADCVPILVAGEHAVAAIHAGWRGLAAGVVAAAMALMRSLDAGPFVAAVGPRISAAAFEVGDEVVTALGSLAFTTGRSARGRPLIDLGAGCARALAAEGVADIDVLDVCTVHTPGWCSFRRDGVGAGRAASAILRRA